MKLKNIFIKYLIVSGINGNNMDNNFPKPTALKCSALNKYNLVVWGDDLRMMLLISQMKQKKIITERA